MTALYLILFLLAAVFFVLSAFNVSARNLNLTALGLFCWVLVPLLQTLQKLS